MKSIDENIIKDLIKNDNITQLQNFIKENNLKLEEVNNENFDLLIYSIENDASIRIINLVVCNCHYETLNYTFNFENERYQQSNNFMNGFLEDNVYENYKVPLFLAINRERFDIAHLLLKNKASINYSITINDGENLNIIQYLFRINKNLIHFNNKIIEYVLRSGFYLKGISTNLISKLIHEYKNESIEFIFKHYIFNNDFILTLLNFYSNGITFTDMEFQEIIITEKNKIEINDSMYDEAICSGNCDALNILLDYDNSPREKIIDRIYYYDILALTVKKNNYSLVKKIIEDNLFDLKTINFERNLIEAIENNNISILKLLMEALLHFEYPGFQSIDFERVLLVASKRNNNGIMNYLIEVLLNISYQGNKFMNSLDLSSIKKYDTRFLTLIVNVAIKIRNLKLIRCIMEDEDLKSKIDINGKDKNEECPIITAFEDMTYYADEIEIFDYLLKHGVNCNTKDWCGRHLFSSAINYRKYMAATCLLKQNIPILEEEISTTEETEEEYHPLLKAIYYHDLNKVISLINHRKQNKVSLDMSKGMSMAMAMNNDFVIYFPEYGFTPLILSYLLNYKDIFEFLIPYSDINELDANGYSILHYAILKEDLDTTQLLISLGADVNFKENKNGRGNSALDISICIRNKEIFEVLLNSQNILLNETNEWGVTPLMTIIDIDSYRMEDKLEIMESLIDRGSDVNFIDIFGHSPLTCAIQKRSLSMVRLLIEHGANVNYIIEDRNYSKHTKDKSLLMYAIELGELAIVQYLVECPTDIDLDYGLDYGDLITTIEKNGKTEILEYLIRYRQNKKKDNKDGDDGNDDDGNDDDDDDDFIMELMDEIIFLNKLNLLKQLVENQMIDINCKDKHGNIPLVYAIKHSRKQMVNYLIDQGANLQNINNYGETIESLSYKVYDFRNKNCDYFRENSSLSIYKKIKRLFSTSIKKEL